MTKLRNSTRGFTAVEAVVVLVVIAIVVGVTMVQVDKRRQAMLRQESAANLRTVWAIAGGRTRTNSAGGDGFVVIPRKWPLLSTTPGQLAPEPTDELIGRMQAQERNKALKNPLGSSIPNTFISPAHPDAERMGKDALADPASAITDASYWYPGYGLANEEAGLAFVDAYRKTVEETGKPPSDIVLKVRPFDSGSGDKKDKVVRLLFLGGIRVNTPIMIERPGLQRGGSNVLFMDGHVEFIPYPGKWPMTRKFIKALESLDELKESNADKPEK